LRGRSPLRPAGNIGAINDHSASRKSLGYRHTFERLLEAAGERDACRQMVELLSLAHERACEAELADLLAQGLATGILPDMAALRARFAPDPAALPEVVVVLTPLADYDALLMGEAA
jgi:hypothetical protein